MTGVHTTASFIHKYCLSPVFIKDIVFLIPGMGAIWKRRSYRLGHSFINRLKTERRDICHVKTSRMKLKEITNIDLFSKGYVLSEEPFDIKPVLCIAK